MKTPRTDRQSDYEQQTDDPEVLLLLRGIDSVLMSSQQFQCHVAREEKRAIRRALRALVWRTLMEDDEARSRDAQGY
jgi:hypothetical protein